MAKSIDSYSSKRTPTRYSSDSNPEPVNRCSLVSIAIILVFALFLIFAGVDTLGTVASMEKSITEQAKVCLAEFSKMQCNSLELSF